MLGDLGVSTLRSIKTMTQFSSLLSTKPAMLPASMLGDYSTSASWTPSCFPRRTDLLRNLFLITSLLNLLSFPFPVWIIIPAILPATMLGYYSMSASSTPSEFSHRRFDLLEACFLQVILDLASINRTTNRSAAKLTCSFF
jgi:hypothetical protein